MPYAAADFIRAAVAAAVLVDGLGCLDALGVDDHGDGLRRLAAEEVDGPAELVTDEIDDAGGGRAPGETVNHAPGRLVSRHRPPLDPVVDEVADAFADVAPGPFLRPTLADLAGRWRQHSKPCATAVTISGPCCPPRPAPVARVTGNRSALHPSARCDGGAHEARRGYVGVADCVGQALPPPL